MRERERRGENHHHIKAIVMPRRKKITQKPIEDFVKRKACYRKRREILLKMVEDLTTLCDIDACAFILGPGDDVPNVWPSHDKAKEMLDKFENAPLSTRLKKNITPQVYIERANNKVENQLVELRKKNDEIDMSDLMHQIHDDGRSLSDFDASDISRLLSYVEEKLKGVRVKTGFSEQQLPPKPPTPQVSCPLQNDKIDSWDNIDEQVLQQQSFIDDLKEDGKINSGFDNNLGSNIGLPPPNTHVGDVDFEPFNQGYVDMMLPPENFGGLANESGLGFGVLPRDYFIGSNGNNDSELLYGSYYSEIGGNDIWSSYGNFGGKIVGSDDVMLPFNNNSQGNINETCLGIGQHDENQGGSINNVGLWNHQITLGASNDGVALERSNPNFVGTTSGENLNLGFPSHANLASSGERSDIELQEFSP